MKSCNDIKYNCLEETLKAIGKTVFVKFYFDFKDMTVSRERLAQKLFVENFRSKSVQQGFRIQRARYIFKIGQELEALKLIIESARIDDDVKQQARNILRSELQSQLVLKDIEDEMFLQELNKDIVYSNQSEFKYLNSPKDSREMVISTISTYPRSRAVSRRALSRANYLCECDNSHFLFKRRNSEINYTEPHHLVPLSASKDFPGIDLDREQNVVSLCSSCHNLLHYGADVDSILKRLYYQRKDLLEKVGIRIEYETLKKYYM